MENIFAYGTLMSPEIQKKIFGRELIGENRSLKWYTISKINIDGIDYPNIIPSIDDVVKGKLYQLTNQELAIADDYEGDEYNRIKIKFLDNISAWVYIAL